MKAGDGDRSSTRGFSLSTILGPLLLCAALLLVFDTIMLARTLALFHFPGELDEFGMAQRGGFGVAAQLESFARQVGVLGLPEVEDVLARLDEALGLSASPADVACALSKEAREAEEVIALAREGVRGSGRNAEKKGEMEEQVRKLQEEVRVFREELGKLSEAAGLAELSGPGIVVLAFDAEDGFRSREIIHDKDVRDIINLLFWSGAKGVEVGGRRIIAQSCIRCAGPILLVNHQPVAVNPVAIRAVGDPDSLAEGLFELCDKLKIDGKRLEIEAKEMITLSAHSREYYRSAH